MRSHPPRQGDLALIRLRIARRLRILVERPRCPGPIAFVFSGGSSLGALQVGMLRAVLEAGIQPDFLVGTSAGALNAAFVAKGITTGTVADLAAIWGAMRTRDVFP